MKHRAIVLTGAALLLPAAAWCAEGGEAAGGGGSWLSLIFYVINFIVFVAVLVYWVGPKARHFFAERARTIRATLAVAKTSCQEAQDLANRAAERMARLEDDKARLRSNLDSETAHIATKIREMGRETAARIKRDAQLTAGAMSGAAHRHVREMLAQATGRLARDMVAKGFRADDQKRMLEIFEQKLGQEAGQ